MSDKKETVESQQNIVSKGQNDLMAIFKNPSHQIPVQSQSSYPQIHQNLLFPVSSSFLSSSVPDPTNYAPNPPSLQISSLNLDSKSINAYSSNPKSQDFKINRFLRSGVESEEQLEFDDFISLEEINEQNILTRRSANLCLYEDVDAVKQNYASNYLTEHSWDPRKILDETHPRHKSAPGQGTITGVLIPCLQNLLGIILFTRVPYIVGLAGIGNVLLILSCILVCVLLTTLSLASIASNGLLPPGGTYYIISRNLGKEIGVGVGLTFCLGLSFSASIFILGATECMEYIREYFFVSKSILDGARTIYEVEETTSSMVTFNNGWDIFFSERSLSTLCLWILGCVALYGSKNIRRFSFVVISCTIITVVGILVGLFSSNRSRLNPIRSQVPGFPGEFAHNWTSKTSFTASDFFRILALFFPALTGIMVGSNRSGDLKTPGKSITKGTFTALFCSTFIYACFIVLFGTVCSNQFLTVQQPNIGLPVSVVGWPHPLVILIGCTLSSLGAAMQSFIGASKLLYHVSKDDIIPGLGVFKTTYYSEPIPAMILIFTLIQTIILIGSFDGAARVNSMFYLACFACINISTALLSFMQYPNWRPKFHFNHWALSLTGFIVCIVFMFLIDWVFAILVLFALGLLYKYVELRGAEVEFGNGIRGLNLSVAQKNLLILEKHDLSIINWRPQIMAILDIDQKTHLPKEDSILRFLSQLRKGGGLAMVISISQGFILEESFRVGEHIRESNELLRRLMNQYNIEGFPEVIISPEPISSCLTIIQSIGIGVLRPNTILLPYPIDWKIEKGNSLGTSENFVTLVRSIIKLEKVIVILKKGNQKFPICTDNPFGAHDYIDVFWIMHDGGILTILPYILKKHRVWRKTKIRVFCVAQEDDDTIQMKKDLESLLLRFRIEAEAIVLELNENVCINEFTYEKTANIHFRQEFVNQSKTDSTLMNVAPRKFRQNTKRTDKEHTEYMSTSIHINKLIKNHCGESSLIFMNLPCPNREQNSDDYMEYLDALTFELPHVVLIKGTGTEVVTVFS